MMPLSRVCAALLIYCTPAASLAGAAAEEDPFPHFALPRPNGRQIARLGTRWLVVTPDASGQRAWLASGPSSSTVTLAGWEKILFLSPNQQGLFRSAGPYPALPSLAVDSGGGVHALWGSGGAIWYARCIGAAGRPAALAERRSWTGADGKEPKAVLDNALPGDLTVTAAGEVWIAAVKRGVGRTLSLCLARHAGGRWQIEELADGVGFHPPVLHVLPDGSAHLAWSDTRGQVLYLRYRRGAKSEPRVLCRGGYSQNGRHPALVSNGRQVLIAYETLYDEIEYAMEEDGKWQTAQRLSRLDPRFSADVLHSPQLALDPHGVVWLFFADATRKFTYFTRWLGSGWSDIHDGRGIYYRTLRFESNYLSPDWLGVEKHPPTQSADIGMVLANSLAAEKKELHRIPVPAPAAAPGSSVLFFDLLEIARLEGVELVLDEACKHPKNPLLVQGPPGSFDQDRVFNHGSVLYDGDRFRMWYAGVHRQRGVYWWEWLRIGYAESKDGVAWEKVPTGVSGMDQGPDRNLLPALPWPCVVFKDQSERDPQRRYKVVQFDRHQRQLMAAVRGEYDMEAPTCPGRLYQSPDGIHWSSEPIAITFPDGKPRELVVQSFFIDPNDPDPARRWKVYGYASLASRRRAGCFAYSADGRKWISYPRNPILDATVSEVPLTPAGPQSQIHDTVVFPYRGYYVALFHAQHDAYFLDVELAISRDGEHFTHVKPGRKVIALGPAEAWDWQQILQSTPVVAEDRLWLYYGGQAPPADKAAKRELDNEALRGAAGLATLRLDGFTHLRLQKGKTSGSVTTVPFSVGARGPLHLVLNAVCSPEATVVAEVLDAGTGQPVPGFTRNDCEVLSADALRSIVHWKGGDRLPLAGRKQVAFRFWLTAKGDSGPKLYGFHLASPAAPALPREK